VNDVPMYPLFLNLCKRDCLVVGGNQIAEAKIRDLLQAGARVTVVAPEATNVIASLACAQQVRWQKRHYQTGDLRDRFLVVTVADASTNAKVYTDAEARSTLCNAVDDIEHCNCFASSVVRRGPLQIAISTGGKSPALAQRLRVELEQQFGQEYFSWVKELGEQRRRLFSEPNLDPDARKRELHRQASAAAFESFRQSRSQEMS
jgi:precorrin-2 dehydrogenase/sirohydrochlorin ferrochelatase